MKTQITILVSIVFLFFLSLFFNQLNAQTGWVQQSSGTGSTLHSVTFTDINTGTAVGANGTIRRTTNGGINWFPQISGTSSTLYSVHFVNANTGTIVGSGGIIRRTINGGINWFPQMGGTSNTLYSVYFINANIGTIVGAGGVIRRTTNGGVNWFSQLSGTTNNLNSVYFINANTGTTVGRYGTVRKTTNGGINWFSQSVPTTTYELTSVYFLNASTGIITKSNYDYTRSIYRTTNGGIIWNEIYTGSVHTLRAVDFPSSSSGYLIGDEGDIFKSSDGGLTWSFFSAGVMNWFYDGDFVNETTGWVVGTSGIILKTTTGGVVVPDPPSSLIGFAISDTSIFLAWYDNSTNETGFKIERSINSMSNWALIDSVGANVENYVDDNGLVPNNTYFYRVYAYKFGANSPYSNTIFVYLTDIKKISTNIPEEYNLFQNYPNPFNPSTNIKFDIPKPSQVKIIIYDNLGKVIEELVERKLSAGSYEVNWNGSNYPSGIYFYRLITEKYVNTKKMLIIK